MIIKTPNGKQFELKYNLFDHQKETFRFIEKHKKCYIFSDAGTGKTDPIIANIAYNILQNKSKKVLIISTLSTLENVWLNTIKEHNLLDIMNPVIVHEEKKDAKIKKENILKENKHTTYIINPSGLKNLQELLLKIKWDYIAVDEATCFKNTGTEQYKVLLKLIKQNNPEYFLLATGTPVANEPVNALGLLRLFYPTQYSNKNNFRSLVETHIKDFIWIPKKDAMDTLSKLLQPAICYKKIDVIKDLKQTEYFYEKFEMSEIQKKHFEKMRADFVVEIEKGNHIESVNSAIKLNKMLQIIGGSLIDEDNKTHYFDVSSKINLLKNILKNKVEKKCIIFCSHKAQLKIIYQSLKDEYTTAIVEGDVSNKDRQDIFYRFQKTEEIDVIIAMPQTMAHGITLTTADAIIYYNPVFSNEIYLQANARISRPSQTRTPKVFHLWCNNVDFAIYEKLQSRMTSQDYLLSILTES